MKNLNKNPLAWFILSTIIGYIAIINGDFESMVLIFFAIILSKQIELINVNKEK
ncbi:MAG: hypothetical protein US18_C0031G0002 [Parcubacteria group bacterium GW2011_GWB1_36_5]|nr:MAG: hypothetical protein US12_C0007G0004 [Parcubacteria group bacterium GW2011_GWA2_36_24]KKQ06820.1 MAG: hypothetical protein US18_C0031G0002 [Parcubacteria group bacterium GW2011_GWB1_36_5]